MDEVLDDLRDYLDRARSYGAITRQEHLTLQAALRGTTSSRPPRAEYLDLVADVARILGSSSDARLGSDAEQIADLVFTHYLRPRASMTWAMLHHLHTGHSTTTSLDDPGSCHDCPARPELLR